MREPFTQLYVHLVWATWDRLPLITPVVEGPLYRALQAKAAALKGEALAVGGLEDHVHVLLRFPTTASLADLVKRLKGSTSHLMTHGLAEPVPLKWQGGYGAFTVARGDLTLVCDYVLHQRIRHGQNLLRSELERTECESE